MPNLPWPKNTIAMLTLVGLVDTVQIVNVHHFEASQVRETGFVSDTEAMNWSGELADHWVTNLKTAYLAMHTNDYVLQVVKAQVVERPDVFRHKLTPTERPQASSNVGTLVTAAEALQVAVVLKWKTPQAGKSTRGRTYIGPIPSTHYSSGRLALTAVPGVPSYAAYKDAMIAAYSPTGTASANFRLTIYSRPYNMGEYQYASRKTGTMTVVTPQDYAGNSTNVIVGEVDQILRTQRRREYGVGS